ncbi:hypothetical protein OROMI_011871 [Orobanche minor]
MLDRIWNVVFRSELQFAPFSVKVREGRLRWFDHVRRRLASAPVRKVETISVEGMRRRGRPRRTWEEQLKLDLKALNLVEASRYEFLETPDQSFGFSFGKWFFSRVSGLGFFG